MYHKKHDNASTQLTGGSNASSIYRVGNTVHRAMSSNHKFIHELLLHLERCDFHEAPRFLGINNKNEEILSYIGGEVPRGKELSYDQISACIMIMRRLHDVAALSHLCGAQETICHYDFAPWNIIFNNNLPTGIIDFDDCRPGKRIEDVAYFLWTFLDLGNPKYDDNNQLNRMANLCQDYQLEASDRMTSAILNQQERILIYREDIVKTTSIQEKRYFSVNAIVRIKVAMKWIKSNQKKIDDIM